MGKASAWWCPGMGVSVHTGKEGGSLRELVMVAVMGGWPHLKGIYPINDRLRIMRVSYSLSKKGLTNLEREKTKMNPVRLDCDWCYQHVVTVFNVCNYDKQTEV